MSSLFGSLSIAVRSLLVQQGALQTTANNISNINTPGFSRQRPVLRADDPFFVGSIQFGTGVDLAKVESIRDGILELRLHQETQQEGNLEAFLGALSQVEALFNEAGGIGLEGVLSNFFNSLQDLSTDPNNVPLRQAVLTAADNLASEFRRLVGGLQTVQGSLDRDLAQTVGKINKLTGEIAALNAKVAGLERAGLESGIFSDQRTLLIRELSSLVDVSVIDAGGGSVTLSTSRGEALVVEDQGFQLQTQIDPATGFLHVFSQGSDITATITAGQLGGLIQGRDQAIPSVLADLDTLAAGLANAFNAAHRAGFDLAGASGVDFFLPPPVSGVGAASAFAVAITDPALLAASSDGSPGSNGNVAALLAVQDQNAAGGQKIADFYANLVGRIGTDTSNTADRLETESLLLRQLQNQRAAISGVSLDEEAANLIRFQRAFQAAAHVISVVDELTQTVVNLGRN